MPKDPSLPRDPPEWLGGTRCLLAAAEDVLRALRSHLSQVDSRNQGASAADPRHRSEPDALAYRYRAGQLEPIEHPDLYPLSELLGVDEPIARLSENARAFCSGRPYLDVLLYGERGTGKSSALRGLLAEFHSRGLRLVEIESADLLDLSQLFALLRPRPEYFILVCDDLSFEDADPSVRRLKAVLDGGLERRPSNVMIGVTSNRRRLLSERASDNLESYRDEAGELHLSESVHEKLSLSDRFGLALAFWGFRQETYLDIVWQHAVSLGLDQHRSREEISSFALQFALRQGGRSGRAAKQACIALLQRVGSDTEDSQTGRSS